MANGGRSSNSKERELSIVNPEKLLRFQEMLMDRMCLSNTNQETLKTRSSPSNMLTTLKLTENTQRERPIKSSGSKSVCLSQFIPE
jgi:hypothetical protein